jgi:hypothetical protein
VTHHRNIIKRLAAIGAVAAAFGAWVSPAAASPSAARAGTARYHNIAAPMSEGSSTRRARASARTIRWTEQQLDQLAIAYAQKNPGWTPPDASVATTTAAQKTWTPDALDALAAAYAARNPGWTRP